MQPRFFAVITLLVSIALVSSLGNSVTSTAQTSISFCDFVERFKIIDRPQQITINDLPWLESLPDFGSGTIAEFRTLLQSDGAITSPNQLDLLPSRNVSSKMKLLLRAFFNLGGQDNCQITV